MKQDVGWFDISVDNAFFMHVVKANEDHFDNFDGLSLVYFLFFLNEGVEIALVAEFGDDVGVVLGLIHIVELHNIGTFNGLQGFNFLLKEVAMDWVIDHFHVYYLDGHLHRVVNVLPLEHCGGIALPYLLVQIVGVILNNFLRLINCRHIRYRLLIIIK